MGVVVRFLDPAATHLKSEAQKIGQYLINQGGGGQNKILDGFIVRAVATAKTAVVTVLGMPYAFTSPIQNIYGIGLVREIRMLLPDGRKLLDNPGPAFAPAETPYRPYSEGVAITTPGALASTRTGSWSTTDPVFHPGVITEAGVRLLASGPYVDTVIYRNTTGRKTRLTTAGSDLIEYRVGAPVTPGEIAYIILSAATMGFSPGSTSEPTIGATCRATEKSAEDGFVVTHVQDIAHYVGYHIDMQTSALEVVWRRDIGATGIVSIFYAGDQLRALQYVADLNDEDDENDYYQLVALSPEDGTGSITNVLPFLEGRVNNPTPYIMDGLPWFFCPRKLPSDELPLLEQIWASADDLDCVLVGPAGEVVQVSTPGYYVQRGTNRIARGDSSTNDGTVGGGSLAGRVAYYGSNTLPEYGVSNACVYAPGVLAVVVCPNADFALPTQRRYIALVDAVSGAMISVGTAVVANRDVWYGVSVSCFEQGEVDSGGDLIVHGALLVSVFRPHVTSLDGATTPNPGTIGVLVTIDGGQTLEPLYQAPTYSAGQPVQRATYLGSPLIPAKIGETRNQWISGREDRLV